MKAVLRTKFKALTSLIKKLEIFYTSNLTGQLKALEQKEANTPKRSRCHEITNLRTEINQLETKKTIQRINKKRAGSLRRNNR